ncbi:hypothetical protein VitviT2T_028143 [Vitis vinifera]|uniref:Mei2-like C-terminal RNA recognition motif domain-containing protein n=1 Tax=Vitis vinifera TaxID=29760 RepID=A0ABY9DSQ9_VITVI|nr:hypothetical protein VitviT2T_028143 [Vitis vinifera]
MDAKATAATLQLVYCGIESLNHTYLVASKKRNKCNVGYAFVNMIGPLHIVPLHQAFNGKKWEKFNSEKVASLAYAQI